ncbi:hypothetical protein D3C71_1874570 [compost metagenome]
MLRQLCRIGLADAQLLRHFFIPLGKLADNALENSLLPRKMLIQRAFLDANRTGDVPDRHTVVALNRKQPQRFKNNPLPGAAHICPTPFG